MHGDLGAVPTGYRDLPARLDPTRVGPTASSRLVSVVVELPASRRIDAASTCETGPSHVWTTPIDAFPFASGRPAWACQWAPSSGTTWKVTDQRGIDARRLRRDAACSEYVKPGCHRALGTGLPGQAAALLHRAIRAW